MQMPNGEIRKALLNSVRAAMMWRSTTQRLSTLEEQEEEEMNINIINKTIVMIIRRTIITIMSKYGTPCLLSGQI